MLLQVSSHVAGPSLHLAFQLTIVRNQQLHLIYILLMHLVPQIN